MVQNFNLALKEFAIIKISFSQVNICVCTKCTSQNEQTEKTQIIVNLTLRLSKNRKLSLKNLLGKEPKTLKQYLQLKRQKKKHLNINYLKINNPLKCFLF